MKAPLRILLIDNFDSFTYNIVHALRDLGQSELNVLRNHQLPLDRMADYDLVLASPGPGLPEDSGDLLKAVEICLLEKIPYLGICLGLQALGIACGGRLQRLHRVAHGVEEICENLAPAHPLFDRLPPKFPIGRYHSWALDPQHLSPQLEVLATTDDGVIQAAAHRIYPAFGVQFHPESIMTAQAGPQILNNVLQIASAHVYHPAA